MNTAMTSEPEWRKELSPDGSKPAGLRHCINGVALNFKPEEKQE